MTDLPSADKPFPVLDRIILKYICAGNKPFNCTKAQWQLRHSEDTVYEHHRAPFSNAISTQIQLRSLPPDAVLLNEQNFIMVHVPHDCDEMKALAARGMNPAYMLDDQIKGRYGLSDRNAYGVYHVYEKMKKFGKVINLFSEKKPREYTIIFERTAYKALAMELLKRLADASQAKDILDARSASVVKLDYKDKSSEAVATLKRIAENAALDANDIEGLVIEAAKSNKFEFATALREIAADMFPEAGFKHRDAIAEENRKKGIGHPPV